MRSAEVEFVEFADAASAQLRRTAFCCAETGIRRRIWRRRRWRRCSCPWRKIRRRGAEHAYAHRILVNTYLDGTRLKRSGEILTDRFPDRAAEPQALETRLVVLAALDTLPAKARAVVVLRYWEDLSIEQVADVLGCSPGNVKSHSARALEKLRQVLCGFACQFHGGAGVFGHTAQFAGGGADL